MFSYVYLLKYIERIHELRGGTKRNTNLCNPLDCRECPFHSFNREGEDSECCVYKDVVKFCGESVIGTQEYKDVKVNFSTFSRIIRENIKENRLKQLGNP